MDAKQTDDNPDTLRTFFDPHSGIRGAVIPMPDAVREIAERLCDAPCTMAAALERLRATGAGAFSVPSGFPCIVLRHDDANGRQHIFRVVRFR